jgi:hypothetical protein
LLGSYKNPLKVVGKKLPARQAYHAIKHIVHMNIVAMNEARIMLITIKDIMTIEIMFLSRQLYHNSKTANKHSGGTQ